MPHSANRFALSFAALMLGCTALSNGAQAGWFDFESDAKPAAEKKTVVKKDEVQPAATLDGSIRQAQLLRLAGEYPDAIRHLSQLMMIASDDPRVVGEYGKTLASMGRPQEAVNFLGRAVQLSPGDWSLYSAMGVAFDQLGKPSDAQIAYDHALVLKPGEPSVLNNYALSRMLAKDPEGAKKLIARAEIAGGASDPKIARNIALINKLSPDAPSLALAPAPAAKVAVAAPQPAPHAPVTQRPLQAMASNPLPPFVAVPPSPIGAPRQLTHAPATDAAQPPRVAPGVVMQRVPVDPLAGPVPAKVAAAHDSHAAKADKQAAAVKTATSQDIQAKNTQVKADAIARELAAKADKQVAASDTKPEAAKPDAAKPAAAKPVGQLAAKPAETKSTEAKPTRLAEAKPVPAKAKAAKDSIPGLRLSANAY